MDIHIASDTDYGVPFIFTFDDREVSYAQAIAEADANTELKWRIAEDSDIKISDDFEDVYNEVEAKTDDPGLAWDTALLYVEAEHG